MKQRCPYKRLRRLVVALFVLCFVIVPGSFAFAQDRVRTITFEEAWQITLENNRDIKKAVEFRRKVMGIYVEQRAAALPQLTATTTGTRSWDRAQAAAQTIAPIPVTPTYTITPRAVPSDATNTAYTVGLTQALFTWGQVGAAIKAAKFGMASAEDELHITRQAALRDVSQSFYDVLLAKETYAIAVQNLRQKEAHADQARLRFAAGVATEYDALAAQVAVDNARPDAIRAENAVRTLREQLRSLLGVAEEIDVTGELQRPMEAAPEYEEALQTAYRKKPELADVRNKIAYSKEFVKIAQAGDKPRVDLKASGGYRELAIGPTEYEGKTWSVGLTVSFPFFDGFRTKGKVDQAKSEVSTAKIEEAKALDSIAISVRTSLNKVKESTGIVQGLSGTVSAAERLAEMAAKGYEYGVKTHLDVEDAELNLSQAKLSLASARRDYAVAKVTLAWAMGVLEDGATGR